MPKFTHVLEVEYTPSFRSSSIESMFDVPAQTMLSKTWEVDMPIENEEWSIGMIVGPSGSGKTTIAKKAFEGAKFFDGLRHDNWKEKCFVDDFSKSLTVKEIVTALSQVGFSSPVSWILPFSALSNGQKFRAEIARLTLETPKDEILVIDEFTSVVDRQVAKVCSNAVQKMVRRNGGKMVAVSCHDDIIDWLLPDWVYYVDTGEFKLTRGILRRPEIKLTIQRVHHSAWRLFKGHHYLSADVNTSAHCFVAFIDETPVAFAAALPFPHHIVKNVWKGHRTVVLPDYQGIGIGNILSESVAQHFTDMGKVYRSVTSHPAMIKHRTTSPLWIKDRNASLVSPQGKTGMMNETSANRWTSSFEYVGTDPELYKRNKIESGKSKKDGERDFIALKMSQIKDLESQIEADPSLSDDLIPQISEIKVTISAYVREMKIKEMRNAKKSKANKTPTKHH